MPKPSLISAALPVCVTLGAVSSSNLIQHASQQGMARAAPRARRRLPLLWIVIIALALRVIVITVGHTYKITPRRDHFQFGWEAGRIARSIALGQGFSSPTDLTTGPSAWTAPVYPYILGQVFQVFGIYSNASAWVILVFNSICSALT